MSVYLNLESNLDSSLNLECSFTTYLHKPLDFNVPYEVALTECIFRDNFMIDLGTIDVYDSSLNLVKKIDVNGIDSEPIECFIRRINEDLYGTDIVMTYVDFMLKYYNPKKHLLKTTGVVSTWLKSPNIPLQEFYSPFFDGNIQKIKLIDYITITTNLFDKGDETLRVIAKNTDFNTTCEKTFTNLYYKPITISHIEYVVIKLKGPSNEKLRFNSSSGKILVILNFRPINRC